VRIQRGSALAAFVAIGTMTLAACGSSHSSAPTSSAGSSSAMTTVNVAFDTNDTALPAWIAQDEGIFAKNHLKVNFTTIQNLSTLPGALGNSFNIVLSTPPELIAAAAKGLSVVEVSGSSLDTPQKPTGEVIVDPKSGITDLAGLEGKSVGTLTLNGTLTYSLEYDLYEHHLNPKGMHLIVMSGPTLEDNLKAGNVQAVISIPPFTDVLAKAGYKELFDPFTAVSGGPTIPIAGIFWIGSKSWANSHPQAVQEWTNSLNQAQNFIKTNPTQARSVLAKYTKLPATVVNHLNLPLYNTSLRPKDIGKWEKAMKALGLLPNPPSTSSLVAKF